MGMSYACPDPLPGPRQPRKDEERGSGSNSDSQDSLCREYLSNRRGVQKMLGNRK